jgi:hypothetical protein
MSRRSKRKQRDYLHRLRRLQDEAAAVDIISSPTDLHKLLDSPSGSNRARAFMLVRRAIEQGASPEQFLEAAGLHLADPDAITRYEAGIVASEAIASNTQRVWELFLAALPRVGRDSRGDFGHLLLEPLAELDSQGYLLRCREQVSDGNFLILDSLEMCGFDSYGPVWDAAQSFSFEAREQLEAKRRAA